MLSSQSTEVGASNTQTDSYFLYHSIGMYPGKVEDTTRALAEYSTVWGSYNDKQWGHVLLMRKRFTDLWSKLIGAPKGSVTTCENVTSGLYAFVGSLPENYLKGRSVLVTDDCFPSLHFLLSNMAERFGFTLKTVPRRAGEAFVRSEDMLAHWDKSVGLALLTWVTSTASAKCDLPSLVAHGRDMGSLMVADITQAAGLLDFNVMEPRVDATISTSLKWMCGAPGAGMLYVDRRIICMCKPELRGWFSQNNPFSWDLDKFEFAPDARRFDNGTPSSLSALASVPALEWHAKQDSAAMIHHNRDLSMQIIAHADRLGFPLLSPRDPDHRGGSVMMKLPDKAEAAAIVGALRVENISVDHRDEVFRLSPGFITAPDSVDKLFDLVDQVQSARARRMPQREARPDNQAALILQTVGTALLSGDVCIVDCTGTLGPATPILRLDEEFARNTPQVEIHKISEYDEDGPFFAWNWMKLGEHSGTHFDAPHHWISGKDFEDGFTDTLDPQRLIAPVNVIDCSAEATADPDFLLTAERVKDWEAEHGDINPGEWVVMRTDWDSRAHDPTLYLNEDENGDAHSPGPTPECIDYLIARGILGWGTQCIGTDAGLAGDMSPPYPAHNFLHRDNCFGLASLAKLDQLPAKGALLIAAPLKIERGTGSPIRALALVPKRN